MDLERFTSIAPDWKQVFGEADVQTKRMLLASLIERIDVKDEEISMKFRIRMEDFVRETIGFGTPKSVLIRGYRGLVLDKLIIRMKGKTGYEVIYG